MHTVNGLHNAFMNVNNRLDNKKIYMTNILIFLSVNHQNSLMRFVKRMDVE